MKLIHILALATAVSLTAGAQNTGTTSGQTAGQPSPSPKAQGVPAAGKASPTPAAASKTGGSSSAAKPAVSTGTVKDKSGQNTVKASPTSKTGQAAATKTGHATTSKTGQAAPASKSAASTPAAAAKVTPAPAKNSAAPATAKKGAPAPTAAAQKSGTTVPKPGPVATKTNTAAMPKATAPKAAAPKTSAPKPATATTSAAAKKVTSKTGQAMMGKPKVEKPKVEAPKEAAKAPAPEKKQTRLVGAAGRRDPFVSPIRDRSNVSPTASCTSGKRCLAIPELVLQGTVRDITGKMMAVVSTSNRRTYTLRENDQVFNGSVEKITSDSIIFREYVKDALGRESAKEVVKKLGPTS